MPFDPELLERMRAVLSGRKGVIEKKMFGGYCWMLHGNMLCGVELGRFMFRVGKALEVESLSRPGAAPMGITGKPMPGYVWVRADEAEGHRLVDWVELASSFAKSLPRK